jgi:lipopolysaccharide transport system ATP-binding protein
MLHWVDEAAFFQVAMKRDEYFFGGVVDLGMSAAW